MVNAVNGIAVKTVAFLVLQRGTYQRRVQSVREGTMEGPGSVLVNVDGLTPKL
jgi:hypothetical protein